jgi:hypothetical protein
MNREKSHAAILPKCLLRAVTVMDGPIDDQYAVHALLGECSVGRDRHAVEQAKAHRVMRTRVMPWRPHQAQGRRFFASNYPTNSVSGCPCRQCGDVIGAPADNRVRFDPHAARRGIELDMLDVVRIVNTFKLLSCGRLPLRNVAPGD